MQEGVDSQKARMGREDDVSPARCASGVALSSNRSARIGTGLYKDGRGEAAAETGLAFGLIGLPGSWRGLVSQADKMSQSDHSATCGHSPTRFSLPFNPAPTFQHRLYVEGKPVTVNCPHKIAN